MDYHLLAGFAFGFISSIPVSVVGVYLVYLKVSTHIREIVNEYGRP
uniref:P3a protein n=1 Tax=Cereal yellow dwarf virus RPV-33WO TaxID=3073343 RepID=A0AA48KZR7_BYDVN|nr:P3a protein [Cereal yellow dwarf virus RPV-33WO]